MLSDREGATINDRRKGKNSLDKKLERQARGIRDSQSQGTFLLLDLKTTRQVQSVLAAEAVTPKPESPWEPAALQKPEATLSSILCVDKADSLKTPGRPSH